MEQYNKEWWEWVAIVAIGITGGVVTLGLILLLSKIGLL